MNHPSKIKTNLNTNIEIKRYPNLKMIAVVWMMTFLGLAIYYFKIEIPMEISFKKGLRYLQEDKPKEALIEFDKVKTIFPEYEPIYLNLASYYARNKKQPQSNENYFQARKICLRTSEIFSQRGLAYAKYKNDLTKATDFYNKHILNNYISKFIYDEEEQ